MKERLLVPVVSLSFSQKGTTHKDIDFDWSGSVNAPPSDTIVVTEQDSEAFSLEPAKFRRI